MTVAERFALAIVICSAGIALSFKAAEHTKRQVDPRICEEVAHELNNAYVEGLISERDARRVIDNCFGGLQ